MPAALKITLTSEENQTLQELEVAQTVPRRTKQRATALRLNAKGLKIKAIADYLGWAESTVRQTIHRSLEIWINRFMGGKRKRKKSYRSRNRLVSSRKMVE